MNSTHTAVEIRARSRASFLVGLILGFVAGVLFALVAAGLVYWLALQLGHTIGNGAL
jgi:CHASE3 domain sensor protein